MTVYELEATEAGYDIGRGGVKLPKLNVTEGHFYPHHTVDFLRQLWDLNETDSSAIGQQTTQRNAGYFVVPASDEKPIIFAFRETTQGPSRFDGQTTTYHFFTAPDQSGGLETVMTATYHGRASEGLVSDRAGVWIQDHEGQRTSLGLFGSVKGDVYLPDPFANYRESGMFTYDSKESQLARQEFEARTREIRDLLA